MSSRPGQTLVEAILAVAVVIVVIVGLVGMAVVSMRSANYGKNQAEAVRLASQQMELLRGTRDNSWEYFSGALTGNSCSSATGCCVSLVSGSITSYASYDCDLNNTFTIKFTHTPAVITDRVTINTVVTFSEGAVSRTVPLTQTFTNWR